MSLLEGAQPLLRGLELEEQVLSEGLLHTTSQLHWLNVVVRCMYQNWVLGREPWG